jgi:hypothetical protein
MEQSPKRRIQLIDLLISVSVFLILVAVSYPYYRYFIDPDAVAYLTMAKRAAEGDTMRLINALWSPLHPALVALCVRGGMEAILAAHVTNGLACLLILVASFAWFRKSNIARDIALQLMIALAAFLTYALYKQLFCDLWQVALLLFYLLLLASSNFLKRPALWIACAALMALAAYAKVYSFYFLLLHLPIALWSLARREKRSFPVVAYASVFLVQIALLLPLVLMMHQKYGFWDLSKSGALNTSWTLVGHKSPRPEIGALIPPPYLNSPYTWEDPYVAEGTLHSRFESASMIKSQLAHTAQASLQAVEAFNQLSPFLLLVLLASALAIVIRKGQNFSERHRLLLTAAAIMPLGYLLLHVEARYLWLLLPVGMMLGAQWLELLRQYISNRKVFLLAAWLFALSFTVYPAYDMKELFRKGEDVHWLAGNLAEHNIRGSFTSNDNPSRAGLLAYWLGCNYYAPANATIEPEQLMADIHRYNIEFYFHHQNGLDATQVGMTDEQGRPYQRVDGNRIKGLQVFLLMH